MEYLTLVMMATMGGHGGHAHCQEDQEEETDDTDHPARTTPTGSPSYLVSDRRLSDFP
ncbi:MAG TPA: hypothetical protein VNC61_15765 [Acidimicrobiales bacterium]|nr:hypothetical protein [Acidimicrobiales bacterium]